MARSPAARSRQPWRPSSSARTSYAEDVGTGSGDDFPVRPASSLQAARDSTNVDRNPEEELEGDFPLPKKQGRWAGTANLLISGSSAPTLIQAAIWITAIWKGNISNDFWYVLVGSIIVLFAHVTQRK